MEVIEVIEREIEVIEVIERGPQGPQGAGITTLTTQGDILYRGATTGERLPIGTTGQILKVSSGGIPEWGAAPSSGVSSVSGTSPIVSSGGSTPAISITAATTSAAGSMSAADKTKLDGIASGAEVNVNADWNASSGDAQILNKPTIPSTAADVGAVPTSRTISAGTGLTGGGDLSANRTLAVSYGTTAGTACQGNDGRISGIESGSITIEGASIAAGNAGFSVTTGNGTGQINTSDGGSIDTSNGGGSINTRGTGSIEFGEVGTRTTLTGTATANRAISLPNAAGTLALTSDITKTAVGLSNVTNNAQTQAAIVPNTAPSAGQLLVGNAGGTAYAPASVSGDATLSSTGALTVANNAVTNAKLAQIATSTIKGRATSGTGNVEDLSSAQVLTILGLLGAIKDMKIVSPSSDVTATSSTTLSNVTGMSFSVAANTTYLLLTNLQVNCGAGGYNCEISFPSILNNGLTASGFGIQLSGSNSVLGLSTTTATTVKVSNRGTNQTTPSFSILLVRTDSTGGTANFQWAQNTSNAAASTLSSNTRALIVPLTT